MSITLPPICLYANIVLAPVQIVKMGIEAEWLAFLQTGDYPECMEEDFGARVKRFRTERGMTLKEVKPRGKSISWLSRLERGGIADCSVPDMIEMAGNLKLVHPGVLLGIMDDKGKLIGPSDSSAVVTRPTWLTEPLPALMRRLGARPFVAEYETEQLVGAGKGKGMIQREGDGRRRSNKEPEQWVVRVEGTCMVPKIEPGQEVIVEANVSPELNDLIVATLDGERYVLKHLVERENVQYLLPLNGDAIPLDEHTELRIVGVVKHVLEPPPRPRKF